jgi:hypothetical protein
MGVGPEELIAEGTEQQAGDAASGEMMRPVMNEMAALAQASQVLQPIVAGIVIEVGSRQHDAGLTHVCRFSDGACRKLFPTRVRAREKPALPNFWLWTGLPDGRISIHSWVETGPAGRNSLTNRARTNFATGPLFPSIDGGGP